MFKIEVFKYDKTQEENGYRGEDFSDYVLQGQEYKEDITQELDTSEITLSGLPLKESFAPETKFIVDVIEYNEINEISRQTYHLCVSSDMVNQTILSDDTYFDHHISFIEPSVVAQKRLVDNISTTYKLKDVSLKEVPAFPQTNVTFDIAPSVYTPDRDFGTYQEQISGLNHTFTVWGKYFEVEGSPYMITPNNVRKDLKYIDISEFEDNGNYYATFEIPKIAIYAGVPNTRNFTKIGYASLDYLIEEFDVNNPYNPTASWTGSFISNSYLTDPVVGAVSEYGGEWLLEQTTARTQTGTTTQVLDYYYKKYTNTSASTPTYITTQIPLQADKQYKVSVSLHLFDDNLPTRPTDFSYYYKYTNTYPIDYAYNDFFVWYSVIGTVTIPNLSYNTFGRQLTYNKTNGTFSYILYSADTGVIMYASSTPYSALALLQKAIINSSIYEKKAGVYIADINNSDLPFYIDDNYTGELSSTLIIENFYNQKNLWQIMIEVGNYIHAIPELKFGRDDRFIITFNKLGRTDEQTKQGDKISIFNSRNVENYICATSSYITNMVQLGGYIEEWVVPKTTNEEYLVYNDTAEIIVSKPIIELLEIKVRRNSDNAIADLTEYIYEENVYKTLSLDYQVIPNRGIAMYYKLGSNIITGGQYQLPQANTNIFSDYTFKKIIYCAFYGYPEPIPTPIPISGYWDSIDVKDYTFYIKYRTKDSVRQNHIRPDIRKYLLNSKYDLFPEHNQFNNQQDVVVDSIKFGNNMFGKLIKTGNNSYEIWEWNTSLENVKHKGELYRINEELYYVATVTHYFYSSYILSKVEYSKDYNELSNVIGIPSEPRFYEISEQSLIWREFALNDIIYLTDKPTDLTYKSNYMFNYDHLADLILGEGTDFAKYAVTVFKADNDTDRYDQTIGEQNTYIEVLNPLNAYSSENTLTYEWDMEDNYSAGDKLVDTDKSAYKSLKAVKYTDIFGKAPLLDFYIIEDLISAPSAAEIATFPESPISTKQGDLRPFVGDYDILATNVKEYDNNFYDRGIGLLKDCREALSINYNLQMAVSSDTFVLSPYVYLPKKENLKIVLLTDEVNKLSTGYISNSTIITPIDTNGNTMNPYFDFVSNKTYSINSWDDTKQVVSQFDIDLPTIFADVNAKHFTGEDGFTKVKSIAILCDVSLDTGIETISSAIPYKTQFVVARNIPENWDKERATASWYWGAPNKDAIFKNIQ